MCLHRGPLFVAAGCVSLGAAGRAGCPGLREKDRVWDQLDSPLLQPWPARQGGGCPLREQGETPSMCVLLALDGAASSPILSCSTVVTLMSEHFVSAWKLDEVCSLNCCLLIHLTSLDMTL